MSRPHNGQSTCSCCGANTREHRHTLMPGLISALAKFAQHGVGPVKLKEVGLTRNQWDNFQKLKYWGMVKQLKRGTWELTEIGRLFLAGGTRLHKHVWTYRGDVQEFEGTEVTIDAIAPDEKVYLEREDYVNA